MQVIAQQDDQHVWLVKLQQNDPFQSPCVGKQSAALVVVYDSTVSNDNRNLITDALITQGCRNGMCMGYDCSGWDDALDWSFLSTDPDFNPPDERFVMTSWHENEPLADTVFTFLKCAGFDAFTPHNFVVVIVGNGPHEEIVTAVRSELTAIYDE